MEILTSFLKELPLYTISRSLNSDNEKKGVELPKAEVNFHYVYIRYPKEIMKMEQHFSALQRWLQKL